MDLALTVSDEAGHTIVGVAGELDVYTAPDLEESLAGLISDGRFQLVVDLSEVSFMDSTGLGLLIKALKWTREKSGSLDVVVATEKVRKVFTITGLEGVIPLHDTVAEALGETEA